MSAESWRDGRKSGGLVTPLVGNQIRRAVWKALDQFFVSRTEIARYQDSSAEAVTVEDVQAVDLVIEFRLFMREQQQATMGTRETVRGDERRPPARRHKVRVVRVTPGSVPIIRSNRPGERQNHV